MIDFSKRKGRYLLSDDISSLSGVLTLVDDITDLLVTQQEVDAVGGQSQEGVVGVLDLQRKSGQAKHPVDLSEGNLRFPEQPKVKGQPKPDSR